MNRFLIEGYFEMKPKIGYDDDEESINNLFVD